jgi:hypothetical protein
VSHLQGLDPLETMHRDDFPAHYDLRETLEGLQYEGRVRPPLRLPKVAALDPGQPAVPGQSKHAILG